MKGTIQICKSDFCIKADGDFAKALLVVAAITVVAAILVIASK